MPNVPNPNTAGDTPSDSTAPAIKLAATDLKSIDDAVQELHDALDAKDDSKLSEALNKLDTIIDKALGDPDDGQNPDSNSNNGDGKPDPFADKVAKYAPQGK